MNCKPGDLAIHFGGALGSKSRNCGKIVRLGKFIGSVPGLSGNDRFEVVEGGPIVGVLGSEFYSAEDKYLRPIRPTDGEDETLTWAGKPEQVTA